MTNVEIQKNQAIWSFAEGCSTYKIVICGDTNVGKSSILTRFVENRVPKDITSTIGVAFLTKQVVQGDRLINLELWDTAGQEQYRSLTPLYYRGCDAVLICFDVTWRKSFENTINWLKDLRANTCHNPKILLVANKVDRFDRDVTSIEIVKFSETENISFIETSAMTGENINELFENLANLLPEKQLSLTNHITIDSEDNANVDGSCCIISQFKFNLLRESDLDNFFCNLFQFAFGLHFLCQFFFRREARFFRKIT